MLCKKPPPLSLELSAFYGTVAVKKASSHHLTTQGEDSVRGTNSPQNVLESTFTTCKLEVLSL